MDNKDLLLGLPYTHSPDEAALIRTPGQGSLVHVSRRGQTYLVLFHLLWVVEG